MTEDPFSNFENQIRICREHLAKSDDKDSLKPLFAQLLLVSAYGAYEKAMRDAIEQMAEKSTDGEFVRYLGKATRRYGMPFGSISVGRFRVLESLYAEWDMQIQNEAKEKYERIVEQRHAVAHGRGTDIVWEEIQDMHGMAKEVPQMFIEALRQMRNRTEVKQPHMLG